MGKDNVASLCEALALPIAEEMSLLLWDVVFEKEGAGYYLRYYIDKQDGVDIDDCEAFSRRISDILDEKDPIDQSYCLEVSSPGIERRLNRPEHFVWAIGRKVALRLYRPIDGKKEFAGVLTFYDQMEKRLVLEDEAGKETAFAFSDIASARLHVQF